MAIPPNDSPVPYDVVYSGVARAALDGLVTRAQARGFRVEALEALKEIRRLLQVYPQFGEPVRYHQALGPTEYIGHVWQIVLPYGIDEERRIVYVAQPPRPLPHGALD